MFKSNAMKLQL